jgi:Ca2+-binding RTX toxin-like protein
MRRALLVIAAALALGAIAPAHAEPPLLCLDRDVTDLRPTDAADFLTGLEDGVARGDGGDQYFGGAGTGADVMCGNADADVIVGEGGPDSLDGGPGDDVVSGMAGSDVVRGGDGSDSVQGGSGADVLRAGPGDGVADTLTDGTGEDVIVGGPLDTWLKCEDGDPDDHQGFDGTIGNDPDC